MSKIVPDNFVNPVRVLIHTIATNKKATLVGGLCVWWRRRESNPRPQILRFQLYMFIPSIILTTSYPMDRENK
jgi:hypothetical protein